MLVERIIYCMPYSLVLQDVNDLLQRRRNSQFAGKQFARTALATVVRPVHDREGNEIYSSRTTGLPVDIKLSVHRLKVADSTATNTSRVVNVPITSILKNNRRFGYTFEILTLEQTHVWRMHSLTSYSLALTTRLNRHELLFGRPTPQNMQPVQYI